MSNMDAEGLLARARANVKTRLRAEFHRSPTDIDDANILAESPWPDHHITAGWLYLQIYADLRKKERKTAEAHHLVNKARGLWLGAAEDCHSSHDEYLRASFAKTYLPLWVHRIQNEGQIGGLELDERKAQRQIHQFTLLEDITRDTLTNHRTLSGSRDSLGIAAEVATAGILNRIDFWNGQSRITLPAQPWHDKNIIRPGRSFDLWQFCDNTTSRLQIKYQRNEYTDTDDYEPDFVKVIYLADHLPGITVAKALGRLVRCEPGDSLINSVAESIQSEIDSRGASSQVA